LVFLYLTFPYHRVRGLIEDTVAASGEATVEIGGLGPDPLFGLAAHDVTITLNRHRQMPKQLTLPGRVRAAQQVVETPTEKSDEPKALPIKLERVAVSVGPLGLLFGDPAFDFSVDGLGGEIDGSLALAENKGWQLELDVDALSAKRIPHLQALGPPITGQLDAKANLRLARGRWSAAEGSFELECGSCAIGDGKALLKIPGNALLAMGITLPRVRLGRLAGQLTIDKGTATAKDIGARSEDIELYVEGTLRLRDPLMFSVIDAYVRFKIGSKLKHRDPKLELLESGLASGKRDDGFIGLRITGMLRRPRVAPSKTGLTPRGRHPRPPARRSSRPRGGDSLQHRRSAANPAGAADPTAGRDG